MLLLGLNLDLPVLEAPAENLTKLGTGRRARINKLAQECQTMILISCQF